MSTFVKPSFLLCFRTLLDFCTCSAWLLMVRISILFDAKDKQAYRVEGEFYDF